MGRLGSQRVDYLWLVEHSAADNLVWHDEATSVKPADLIGQVRLGCGAAVLPDVAEEGVPVIDAEAAVQQQRGDFVPRAGE